MDNVIDLDSRRPKEFLFATLALCLSCKHRWVAGVPKDTSLFALECPKCHDQDSFGAVLPSEYMEHFGVKR